MAGTTAYPTALDTVTTLPTAATLSGIELDGDGTDDYLHENVHGVAHEAIVALETKLGTGASTPGAAGKLLVATGAAASAWQNTGVDINGGSIDGITSLTANDAAGPQLANAAATDTTPTLIPNRAEIDTGIGWQSDTLHFIGGGADLGSISASRLSIGGQFTQETNVIRAVFVKGGIVDNTATAIFTITTTDETGDADGGMYSCKVHAVVGHAVSSAGSANSAVKGFSAIFARTMQRDSVGDNTAVSEIVETASAGDDAGARDIGTVTMDVVETSEYVQTVRFTVDLTGTNVDNAKVQLLVELVWSQFTTPPVLAAA